MDAVSQRLGAGCIDLGQAVGQHGTEHLDHLVVAVGCGLQLAARPLERAGQHQPCNGAPLQGSGFVRQRSDMVPRIVNGLTAAEDERMLPDHPFVAL